MDTNSRYDFNERHNDISHTSSNEFETRDRRVVAETKARPVAAECGAGWYHDAAIQDAKDALAHPYR